MERRLKKGVLYGIYSLGLIGLIGTIYLIESSISNKNLDDDNTTYVINTIFDDTVPVVADTNKIIRPYVDSNIKIYKKFYNHADSEESQKEAIITYQNTYLQSSGICYSNETSFDVVAILDGTVIDVKEDKLLGKIVEIRHSNDVISIYQGLNEVSVEKDMRVKAGDMIGKSGTSNLFKDAKNILYFEFIVNGTTVNPEEYYDKQINEL